MNTKRYIEIDNAGTGLTKEELEQGWHFCNDWDGMLVGPGCDEADCCTCGIPAIEAYKVSPENLRKLEERYKEPPSEELLF